MISLTILYVADLTEEEIAEIEEKGAQGAAAFKAREWLMDAKGTVVSADLVRAHVHLFVCPLYLSVPRYPICLASTCCRLLVCRSIPVLRGTRPVGCTFASTSSCVHWHAWASYPGYHGVRRVVAA